MNPIGISDTGRHRDNNEDSYFLSGVPFCGLPNLYIVADGIGGHNAGEVASKEAIRFFKKYCRKNRVNRDEILDFIVGGVVYVNDNVMEMSLENKDYIGMGTTFSACVYDNGRLYIAHVGDSRIYGIYDDKIRQLTTDHSYVNELVKAGSITEEEARSHPKRNVLTQAIGTDSQLMVDGKVIELADCRKVILCTDGLTDMVPENELLLSAKSNNNEEIAKSLVNLANQNGGTDNITLIIFDVGGGPE